MVNPKKKENKYLEQKVISFNCRILLAFNVIEHCLIDPNKSNHISIAR